MYLLGLLKCELITEYREQGDNPHSVANAKDITHGERGAQAHQAR